MTSGDYLSQQYKKYLAAAEESLISLADCVERKNDSLKALRRSYRSAIVSDKATLDHALHLRRIIACMEASDTLSHAVSRLSCQLSMALSYACMMGLNAMDHRNEKECIASRNSIRGITRFILKLPDSVDMVIETSPLIELEEMAFAYTPGTSRSMFLSVINRLKDVSNDKD